MADRLFTFIVSPIHSSLDIVSMYVSCMVLSYSAPDRDVRNILEQITKYGHLFIRTLLQKVLS